MTSPTATRPAPRVVRVRPTPAPRRHVRLTGRGRSLVLLALLLLILAAFAVGRSASSQATAVLEQGPTLTAVTVQPGDTLWSVAHQVAPGRDPRDLVAQIRRLNDLPNASLQVGQQLLLPAAA